MTTSHRPTPGDLAHRPAPKPPVTPAAAIQPGRLRGKERLRPTFHRGLRISRMHPEARLVALTLLGYAHHTTGVVFPRYQPTSEQLAEATGLTPGQVGVQIHVLTQRGWLGIRRIEQGADAGREGLRLTVPALVLEQIRAARAAEQSEPYSG
ncbi:helix-turn-helix domain-containing protein [Streptomyces scabiei]|uniref:helix-turn-helix domain-containing protein n=1 Tax=Streptomyces scabiei TaxID=1930 RepID=UPI0029B08C1D|nr:helix-turn-helix domain-containing protein [Streptomyces scabiei]MDX3217705.1 hypothetical protein [Streptomyces scabiei]